ncbi:MAG: hypothetical protein Fur0041_22970 [Bacteroidia bacterium]
MLRDRNESVSIIDVRSAKEFNKQHIPFALNIPVSQIEAGSFRVGGIFKTQNSVFDEMNYTCRKTNCLKYWYR